MATTVEQHCVSCNVRAHRVAHLLDADGDYEQARKVTQFGSFRWGGIFSVAVPLRDGEIDAEWWEFLRWYDPDLIYIHSREHPDLCEPTDHGLLPFRVISPNPPFHTAYPALMDPTEWLPFEPLPQAALRESEARRGNVPLRNWRAIETEGAPQRDFVEANVGVVHGEAGWSDLSELGVRRLTLERERPLWGLARADIETAQLWQTGLQLSRCVGRGASSKELLLLELRALLVVSEEPNLEDFCLFWSSRASRIGRHPVYWMPLESAGAIPSHVERLLGYDPQDRAGTTGIGLTSATLSQQQLAKLSKSARRPLDPYQVVRPAQLLAELPGDPDFSTPSRVAGCPVGREGASFPVPEPGPEFMRPDSSPGSWVVDIELQALGAVGQGVRFPVSPGLANAMLRAESALGAGRGQETQCRVMRDGRLCLAVAAHHFSIFVRVTEPLAVFRHALQAPSFRWGMEGHHKPRAYRTVERSHAGVGAIHLSTRVAGWAEVRQLLRREGELQPLLRKPCSPRQLADMSGAEQECIEQSLLPFLVERRIVLQGCRLRCEHCQTRQWYPLEDVGQDYRCSACLRVNQTPYSPEQSYRLAPLAHRALHENQLVPLAALALLAGEAKRDFLWVPELRLEDPVAAGLPETDLDISCVRDGDLILGEAAREGGFSTTDVRKLKSLARLLRPAEIVFAVMRPKLRPKDQQRIRQVEEGVAAYGTKVAVFLEHHLLRGRRDATRLPLFAGTRPTRILHRGTSGCGPSTRGVLFDDYDEAMKQGYRPCRVCRPRRS